MIFVFVCLRCVAVAVVFCLCFVVVCFACFVVVFVLFVSVLFSDETSRKNRRTDGQISDKHKQTTSQSVSQTCSQTHKKTDTICYECNFAFRASQFLVVLV